MRLLLDTHAFLWWIADDARLSNRARSAIANRKDECFVSLAMVSADPIFRRYGVTRVW